MHCAADFTQRHRTAERPATSSASKFLHMATALLTSKRCFTVVHYDMLRSRVYTRCNIC